jgi:hypothetical protein
MAEYFKDQNDIKVKNIISFQISENTKKLKIIKLILNLIYNKN